MRESGSLVGLSRRRRSSKEVQSDTESVWGSRSRKGDKYMKRSSWRCVFVLLSAGVLFSQSSYTYSSIDYPGALLTRAFDINDAGTVVGVFRLPGQENRGFMLRQGKFT